MSEEYVTQYNAMLKANAIALAKDHKQTCDNPECGISLYMLRQLLEKAGIELSDDDRMVFL